MPRTDNSSETSTWLLQAKDILDEATTAKAGSQAQGAAPNREGTARDCKTRVGISVST